MRSVDEFELDLVLGGSTEVGEVVVVGDGDDDDDYDPGDGGNDETDDPGDGEDGDNGGDDGETTEPFSPQIMQQTHAKVLAWTNQYKNSSVEYISLIYVFQGQVFTSTPQTLNLPDSAPMLNPDDEIPEGAVVIGFIHNHPDEDGAASDAYPSTGMEVNGHVTGDWAYVDWLQGGKLWESFPEGEGYAGDREVSENLLTYIVTSEGAFEFEIEDYQTMQETDGEKIEPEEAA